MKHVVRTFRAPSQKGQGAVEYILIVGLISLFIFLAVQFLGQNINQAFDKAASDMGEINSNATG